MKKYKIYRQYDGQKCKQVLYNNLKEYYVDFCKQKSLYVIKFKLK